MSDHETQIMRKITWKLIPFLCVCYMAAFLDRVNVGFAKEQLLSDLKMSDAAYGAGAGIFFIGYFLFEIPSNLILERVGARFWIARIMIVWGIISACFAFVQGTTSFYILRFLLGVAEAGFFPGVIFYLTKWFPVAYRTRTVAIFMTAAVASTVVGGPLSGYLLQLDGVLGLRGYKWMFLMEALPSIVLGVLVFLRLPNGPEDAKWLAPAERAWLTERLDQDRVAAGASKHMSLKQGLLDPRVLLLCFIYFTMVVAGYGLDFFLPTLIRRSFPLASTAMVGWLTAIPSVFALFAMVLSGRSSDKRQERKWHYFLAVGCSALGLALASLPVPPVVGLLALAFAVSGRWSSVAPFWGLTTAFLSGSAAAGSIAMINAVGNLGGYFGPQLMGILKDATGSYEMGLRVLSGFALLGGAAVMLVKVKASHRAVVTASVLAVGSLLTANRASAQEAAAPSTPHQKDAKAPSRARDSGSETDWHLDPYGYARFDAMRDSTQSFNDGLQPSLIARVGTYKGDHARAIFTAKDSRLGLSVRAPTFERMAPSGKIEFDFFGVPPTDAKEADAAVFGPVRIRHAFLRLDTPIVDVVAGQYYDLFGWGPTFYPGTVAYLGVPGQVYHRNPQLRLEKRVDLGGLELTTAAAGVRPAQRDSGVPDGEAGVKLAINGWTGAAMQGFGSPDVVPASLGVSGLYRQFEVPAFRSQPGSVAVKQTGYGVAAHALLPIIPAKTPTKRANALTITGEFSTGTGIADMYTGMDGGSRLPLLPDPANLAPDVPYQQNVDSGLVTFDRDFELASINWQAFVVGLQYYLPVDGGRVWVSATYAKVKSDNIKELTPAPSHGGIFTDMEYLDANLATAITPDVVVGFSFQTLQQTFADVSQPTPIYGQLAPPDGPLGSPVEPGTGGKPASARNNRIQLSTMFVF